MSDSAVHRDEFFDSLLGDFLDESGQLLDRLNENLLQLDEWVKSLEGDCQPCNQDLLNEMFRSAHSLKGLSAMLGLTDINTLTHKIENVFDAARKDELRLDGNAVELMFQGVDRLVALVGALREPGAERVECQSVIDGIAAMLRGAGAERGPSNQADAERALAEATTASEPAPAAAEEDPPTERLPVETTIAEAPVPAAATNSAATAPLSDPFEGIRDETQIPAKYLSIFIDEATLTLDQFTETLLALEGGGRRPDLEKLLVTSHRIKGSAASIGLNRGAKLAHLMEDVLQNLLESGGALSPELTDAMLKCSDAIRQYVDSLRTGSGNCEQFTQRAQDLLAAQQLRTEQEQPGPRGAASPGTGPAAGAAARLAGECREDLLRHMPAGMRGCIGQVAFQPSLALVGLKARLVYEKLAAQGEVRAIFPPVEQLDEIEELDCLTFALAGDHPADFIRRQIWVAGVREILIEPVHGQDAGGPPAMASQPPGAQPAAPATPVASAAKPSAERSTPGNRTKDPASDSSGKPAETLRVDIDRLDQLMNLAGQLVINKARFAQIADRLRGAVGMKRSVDVLSTVTTVLESMSTAGQNADSPQALEAELELLRSQARRIQAALEPIRRDVDSLNHARNTVNELFEAVHQLERVSDGIQQSVMDTRMVPIGPLFTRFKRVVRDITRVNGRSIRLVIQGEKTELDKRMIDELGDPLIHMVRNSADHGIEPPEVRTAAGKPAEGTITLDAFHRGNHIVIQVRDDGRGLNRERILQKALDRGLVTAADAERMTPQQVFQLIWEPGLSTAERVTEVSGRGMGMDIVKSKIEDLNGSVELDSVPGQGTTITIKLPLTLAIMPSLMVEIQSDVFAMPMESVVEIVALKRQDFSTVHGRLTARIRGRVVSAVRLDEVFQWSRGSTAAEPLGEETTLVIVGEARRELGLVVSRVIGEEDVVIKSMADNYRNVPGIAGASILGDGRVSLILDLAALIDMASERGAARAAG